MASHAALAERVRKRWKEEAHEAPSEEVELGLGRSVTVRSWAVLKQILGVALDLGFLRIGERHSFADHSKNPVMWIGGRMQMADCWEFAHSTSLVRSTWEILRLPDCLDSLGQTNLGMSIGKSSKMAAERWMNDGKYWETGHRMIPVT